MSLGSALSVANSGLKATRIWADTTSRNIANATSEGYVRKEVDFSTRNGTVEIAGIRREIDTMLDRLDRSETSKMMRQAAIRDSLEVYSASLGGTDGSDAPSARLNDFREKLQMLTSGPGDIALQNATVISAKDLARSYREADGILGLVRAEVNTGISQDVADMNRKMRELDELNRDLTRVEPDTIGAAEMRDEMGRLIDDIAEIVDIQTTTTRDGRINLYTASGTALIEGDTVNRLSFNSGTQTLTAGGIDITPFRPGVRGFANGSLAGMIEMRNQVIPEFQLQLDEGARMLVESFSAADSSLGPGDTGLFTDAGAVYNPANLDGLAGRIEINALVDPDAGGEVRRIRDGIQAATAGPASDPTQVAAFVDVFDVVQTVAPGANIGTGIQILDYAETMVAAQQTTRADAASRFDSLSVSSDSIGAARRNNEGVNTDEELQELMLIEQSYAANAKMLTAVSEMIDTLLRAV